MRSFLIAGSDKKKLLEEARRIAKNEKVNEVDFLIVEDEKIFGIDTFRQIKDKIFLKPLKSPNKAIVLNLLKGATTEAQNSMLKILEEPPPSTIMIILGLKKDSLLPTIVSRCQVIETKEGYVVGDGKELTSILDSDISEKFVSAQNLSKDKEKSLLFIKASILYLRDRMRREELGEEAKSKARMIRELENAYHNLSETNINPRMTLENLFLNL